MLVRFAVLLAALGPALPIGLLIYAIARSNWQRPSPAIAMGAGVLAIICVLLVLPLRFLVLAIPDPLGRNVFEAFGLAGAPEETAKFCLLLTIVLRHEDIDPETDTTLSAGWLGLGFGLAENFLYLARDPHWPVLAAARAASAVPGHVSLGLVMGALATRALKGEGRWITALLLPILLHGLYDLPLLQINALHSSKAVWPILAVLDMGTLAVLLVTTVPRNLAVLLSSTAMAGNPQSRAKWHRIDNATAIIVAVGLLAVVGTCALASARRTASPWLLLNGTVLPFGLIGLWFASPPRGGTATTASHSDGERERLKRRLDSIARREVGADRRDGKDSFREGALHGTGRPATGD